MIDHRPNGTAGLARASLDLAYRLWLWNLTGVFFCIFAFCPVKQNSSEVWHPITDRQPDPHLTNNFWAHNPNLAKICVALTWKMIIQSGQNLAYGTTTELSCHMQNSNLNGSLESYQSKKNFHENSDMSSYTFLKWIPGDMLDWDVYRWCVVCQSLAQTIGDIKAGRVLHWDSQRWFMDRQMLEIKWNRKRYHNLADCLLMCSCS